MHCTESELARLTGQPTASELLIAQMLSESTVAIEDTMQLVDVTAPGAFLSEQVKAWLTAAVTRVTSAVQAGLTASPLLLSAVAPSL
jgi:hypothetical protein